MPYVDFSARYGADRLIGYISYQRPTGRSLPVAVRFRTAGRFASEGPFKSEAFPAP
jgi:hypothetical protein